MQQDLSFLQRPVPGIFFSLFSYSGVHELTCDSVVREVSFAHQNGIDLCYYRASGDALIPRCRSRAMGKFHLEEQFSGLDVMMMLDHDIEFGPGEIIRICQRACEEEAILGGLYCKRARGKGWSSRFKRDKRQIFQIGSEEIAEPEYLATGFMAIPRKCIDKITTALADDGEEFSKAIDGAISAGDRKEVERLIGLSIGLCKDGGPANDCWIYYDYFRTFRTPHTVASCSGYQEFLSEDWAFVNRARASGVKNYIYFHPYLVHHGEYGYTADDAMGDAEKRKVDEYIAKQG